MEKRGMSGVVTTLVIIMVSLVAISIIWVVVRAIIKSNSEGVSTSFGTLTTDLDITVAREQGTDIFLSIIRRSGDQTISQIKFLLSNNTDNEELTLDVNGNWDKLSTQSFTLTPVILTSTNTEEISIVPVYGTGNQKTIGDIADTITLQHGTTGETGGELPGGGELPSGCVLENPLDFCGTSVCGSMESSNCPGEYVSCGECPEGDYCEEGICVTGECPAEDISVTCGTWNCSSRLNNCDDLVTCGPLDGFCPAGEICDAQTGTCNTISPMNSGTVEEVWPGTSGLYFGSVDLPIYDGAVQNFTNRYIAFPGSAELDCLQIISYRLNVTGYDKAHIVFSSETAIQTGDSYNIYEDSTQCYATLA